MPGQIAVVNQRKASRFASESMAFSGEMDDGPGPMLRQQAVEQLSIGDVAVNEDVARVAGKGLQVSQVACVGQRVQVDYAFVAFGQPVQHEIAADEAGAAGDENHALSLFESLDRKPDGWLF